MHADTFASYYCSKLRQLLSDECSVHSQNNPYCLNFLKTYIKFLDLIVSTLRCQHIQLKLCIQQ